MRVYAVGGALRDELLGLAVKDRDFVVVGATPEDMIRRGFKPVGRDFPVFLHPETREEYALARTERKTAPGYTGFVFHAAPDVSLEEDLARRDFTINAMARGQDGALVDPYDGAGDIRRRVLRHVGPAFGEDPVRILRAARFLARFTDFTLADDTLALMRDMVTRGEVDHLVPERVWQELARGLMEAQPSRMIETLRACGALARLLPELDRLFGVPQPPRYHPEVDTGVHVLLVVDWAARQGYELSVRFAALMHDLGKGLTPPALWPSHHGHEEHSARLAELVGERLRVPAECRDLARLTASEHGVFRRAAELRPGTLLKLLTRCDALRRPERFARIIDACSCDHHGRPGFEMRRYAPRDTLLAALAAVQSVDAGAIARSTADPVQIPQRLAHARIRAIAQRLGGAQEELGDD